MTTKIAFLELLAERYPECSIDHGWILDGAGPARHGWGRRAPTGRVYFLGKTTADALEKLRAETERDTLVR